MSRDHVFTIRTPPAADVVIVVPEDKDPFDAMNALARRWFPNQGPFAGDARHAEVRARMLDAEREARDNPLVAAPLRSPTPESPEVAPDGAAKSGGRPEIQGRGEPNDTPPATSLRPSGGAEQQLPPPHARHDVPPGGSSTPESRSPEAATPGPGSRDGRAYIADGDRDAPGRVEKSAPESSGSPVLKAGSSGVRDTSLAAYRALQWSGRLAAQEQLVVSYFFQHPDRTFTRQELARDLGLGINAVCGRVNKLLQEPFVVLVEVGRKTCSVTGNNVNALGLALIEEPTTEGV
jgi:hypothetical protein